MKRLLSRWLALAFTLCLTGCNITTEQPLFSAEDAADVKLEGGYYAMGVDVAYIKVFAGKTVVNTRTDSRMPLDALAIELGEGLYLLQYGEIDKVERTYVMFRYEPDGTGISTAIYNCEEAAVFFRNFGISIKPETGCRMGGVTKERMIRSHRALAKILPATSWDRALVAMPNDEGATKFKARDSFPGKQAVKATASP